MPLARASFTPPKVAVLSTTSDVKIQAQASLSNSNPSGFKAEGVVVENSSSVQS